MRFTPGILTEKEYNLEHLESYMMKKGRITVILLLMCIITIVQYKTSPVISKPGQPRTSIIGTKYVSHDPIKILNDDDFESYGFNGLGTPLKPYLIIGYEIESTIEVLISIEDTSAYFKISNCYLNGKGYSPNGIRLSNVTHGIIENNYIRNNTGGIVLDSSSRNTLSGNTIRDCINIGIVLSSSSNNTLISNGIINCDPHGIVLSSDCKNNILSSNTIQSSSQYGINLMETNHNNTVTSNTITGCILGVMSMSDNNTLSNNGISSCSQHGIWLGYGSNNMMSYNTIYTCTKSGIQLTSSSNNTLIGNSIHDCDEAGITLYSSDNNTLSGNTINNCDDAGITLSNSDNNFLSINTIYGCTPYGIYLEASNKNNNLSYNAVYYCTSYGIYLCPSNNDNNSLSYNTIYKNTGYGLYFEGSSDNNTVKWNNFINNNAGTGNQQAFDDGENNTISSNYWHEWTSPDDNSDRIVDNPYTINGSVNNNDTSPRTAPVPPRVTILTPLAQEYGTKMITVRLAGNIPPPETPGGGGYEYYIEGLDGTNQSWFMSYIRSVANDGTYTLHAYGKILTNISHVSVTFTIDTTPPDVTIVSPTETNYTTNTITVNLSGDAVHNWYYIEEINDDNQIWTQNIDITLDDGDYILHAYGDDSVGNIASDSVSFTVDTVAPAITLESPTNDSTYNSGTIINISVIDSHLETVLYNWDGTTNKTWSGDYLTSLPADETQHILYVYANDSLGRWTSEVFVFTTDDTAPTIDITSPIATTYSQNNVTLTYTVSDGTVTIYINGEANTTDLPSGTIIPNLPNRKHNITIVAVDQVRNIARDTVIFTIDTTGTTSTTTLETTSETTSEKSSETKSISQIGSFPGLFTILLFVVPIVILLRRHKC